MQLSGITKQDGMNCAHLINFLKAGRWNLSGEENELLSEVKRWVQSLALEMANQLRAEASPPSPAPTMRVKSMGSLPTSQETGPKSTATKSKSRKK